MVHHIPNTRGVKKQYKTTRPDFLFFESEVFYWSKFFRWHDTIQVHHTENDSQTLATCLVATTIIHDPKYPNPYCPSKARHITLSKTWEIPITQEQLSKAALHEVLEAVLMPLSEYALAIEKFVGKFRIREDIHYVLDIFHTAIWRMDAANVDNDIRANLSSRGFYQIEKRKEKD